MYIQYELSELQQDYFRCDQWRKILVLTEKGSYANFIENSNNIMTSNSYSMYVAVLQNKSVIWGCMGTAPAPSKVKVDAVGPCKLKLTPKLQLQQLEEQCMYLPVSIHG
jgi:hypothetical protein